MAAYALRADLDRDGEPPARWDLAAGRRDLDIERRRDERSKCDVARSERVPISDLGGDLDRMTARDACSRSPVFTPEHFEAGRSHARDSEQRDRSRHRKADEHRAAPREHRRLLEHDTSSDDRHARGSDVNGVGGRVELHGEGRGRGWGEGRGNSELFACQASAMRAEMMSLPRPGNIGCGSCIRRSASSSAARVVEMQRCPAVSRMRCVMT